MKSVIVSIVLYKSNKDAVYPTIKCLHDEDEISKIVLVDNGGSEWASKLYDFEKVVYIRVGANVGYGAGHNIAIKKYIKNCDYYLICNPDITFERKSISNLVKYADHYQHGLLMPNVLYPDGSRQELCKLLPTPMNLFARRFVPGLAEKLDQQYLLRFADYTRPFHAPSLSGCFMFFNAKNLDELNGFDERFFMYLEDLDLSRRAAMLCGTLYIPQVKVEHKFEKGSYKNKKLLMYHIQSSIKYFNKWGWVFDKNRTIMNKTTLRQF